MNLAPEGGRRMIGSIHRFAGRRQVGRLGRHGRHGALAFVMHQLWNRLVDQGTQALDCLDRAGPVVLGFVYTYQGAHGRYRKTRIEYLLEGLLGAIQHARLQKVLGQFMLGAFTVGLRQIGPGKQALMYPNSALDLAATAKQRSEEQTSEIQSLMQLS